MDDLYQKLSDKDRRCDMFFITFKNLGDREVFIDDEDYHRYWSEAMWMMDCTGNYIVDYAACGYRFCMIIDLFCSGHTIDNTIGLRRMLKSNNNSYTRWYNKKYGQKGSLTKLESVHALRSQRDLLESMRSMYRWLKEMGKDPNEWRFCGRYERRKGYSHGMPPEPYSFPGYLMGQFNGMSERKLYRVITTEDESYWKKVRDSVSVQERANEYRARMALVSDDEADSVSPWRYGDQIIW